MLKAGAAGRRIVTLMSPRGRTSRLGYWRVYLLCVIAVGAIYVLGIGAAMVVGWWAAPLLALLAPVIWIGIATTIRRLHDRGKSAWWLLIFYAPQYAASALMDSPTPTPGPSACWCWPACSPASGDLWRSGSCRGRRGKTGMARRRCVIFGEGGAGAPIPQEGPACS